MNLSVCYMKLNHWTIAQQVLRDCLDLQPANSLCLYRMAMAKACNLDATLAELLEAETHIEQAWVNKDIEPLFAHETPMLTIVNIANYKEAYQAMRDYAKERLVQRKSWEQSKIKTVLKRVHQLGEIEKTIIAEGKVPEEGPSMGSLFCLDGGEDFEAKVISGMYAKYVRIMEFYVDLKDRQQVFYAKAELLKFKELMQDFFFLHKFDLEKLTDAQREVFDQVNSKYKYLSSPIKISRVIVSEEKYKNRFHRVAKEQARDLFESKISNFFNNQSGIVGGDFNVKLFEWVMEDVVKEEQEIIEIKRKQKLIAEVHSTKILYLKFDRDAKLMSQEILSKNRSRG
jgi:hypothetical protein